MVWQLLGKDRKKILYNFLAFSFLFNSAFGTSLVSYADFLSNLRNAKKKITKKIQEHKQKIQKEQAFQKNVKVRINDTEKEIDQINFSIEQMQNQMEEMQKKIDELEKLKPEKLEKIKILKKKLKKFIRLMYMGKIPSAYEIIFGASSFNNFIDRVQLMQYVNSRYLELKNKVKSELDEINYAIREIENLKLKRQETMENCEEQKVNLDQKIKNLDKLYEESKQTQQKIQCELDAESAELKKIDANIDSYYRSLLEQEKNREKNKNKGNKNNKNNNGNNKNTPYIPKFSGNKPKLLWPVQGFTKITSNFYDKENRKKSHGALDIAGSGIYGAPVRAPVDMVITFASYGYNGGYGNLVTSAFQHNGKNYKIYFAHLSRLNTSRGANVSKGDIIGYVGNTGFSKGAHLHFEIRINGKPINPRRYLKGLPPSSGTGYGELPDSIKNVFDSAYDFGKPLREVIEKVGVQCQNALKNFNRRRQVDFDSADNNRFSD